jgi:hypothetical protein
VDQLVISSSTPDGAIPGTAAPSPGTNHPGGNPPGSNLPLSAPLTRRELAERSGRRRAAHRSNPRADDLDLGPVKASPRPADEIRMRTSRTGSGPTSRAARRRAEAAPNRSRRIWGVIIAAAMVLLVPTGSMLRTSVTVADRDLAGIADRPATGESPAVTGPGLTESTATTRSRAPGAPPRPAAASTTSSATGRKGN